MPRKTTKKDAAKIAARKARVTKKTIKKKSSHSQTVDLTQFLLPGVIVFVIVWVISHSATFAGFVFLGILAGNWFGQTYKNKKR